MAAPATGRPVRLIDASRIEAPGGKAWRLHLCFASQEGRMVEAAITPIRHGERLDRLAFQPGEIRIGDRGYPQPDGLRATREAGADAPALIPLTSLEAKEFPVRRLGTLYRVRWQIELAFKRLKSLLHIDQLRARNVDLTRVWLHPHLLFALRIEQTVAEIDAIPS